MDPATSELAQVVTMATSIVGAVVYLQRAQMSALTKLAEIIKPADEGAQLREVRAELRQIDDKVDSLAVDVAFLTGRQHSKRPPSTPKAAPKG